jgi:hypothetical protein
MNAQSYSKMRLMFMAAISNQRIELMIMILVCWHEYQKARDLSLSVLEKQRALFQMHFSYITLGKKSEIITMKCTVTRNSEKN